jgi:ribosomal RNA-processing protein 36
VIEPSAPVRPTHSHSHSHPHSRSRISPIQQPRDPRFLHITGDYKPEKFREQYNFLSNLHTDELKTLRENLKRARKLLANSPRDLRSEREREIERLELAVKRGESTVNRDKREKVETDALQRATREEREKRHQGKAGWWMKSCKSFFLPFVVSSHHFFR